MEGGTSERGRPTSQRWRRFVSFAVLAVVLLLLGVAPFLNSMKPAPGGFRAGCKNNLHRLVVALMQYEHTHGHLPPAVTRDAQGRPMHSWRVYLLPYLEQMEMYRAYRFDEPWYSPHNRRFAQRMPEAFRCPDSLAGENQTSYVAIVGDRAAWPADGTLKLSDIKDPAAETILLVEVADSGINWLEPRDLPFDEAATGIDRSPRGISSNHGSSICIGLCNGQTRYLSKQTPRDILLALLTAAGGESIDEAKLNP